MKKHESLVNSDKKNLSLNEFDFEPKYHIRTRSMIPAVRNESNSEEATSSLSLATSCSIIKSSKKPEISNEAVKKLQKIKFQDSLDSPSKKRSFLSKLTDAKELSGVNSVLRKKRVTQKKTSKGSYSTDSENYSSSSGGFVYCPVVGCDSSGHLSGFPNSRHSTADVCPIYNKLTVEECNRLGPLIEKNYYDIIDKIHKPSTNDSIDNEEKLKNREAFNKELKKIVHIENEPPFKPVANISNITSEIFNSRNKNISSDFILNSITNSLNPKPKKQNKAAQNQIEIPIVNDLEVSEFEFNLFKECLILSAQSKKINLDNGQVLNLPNKLKLTNPKNKIIQFGDYEIESWFRSPYPNDVWQQDKFFICQFCLNYIKSVSTYRRHLEKCLWKHPPGREIYRKDGYSFFEVDGNIDTIYCQNLCLLAKLFLDHKTLYLEVEPFLFYVLTKFNNENGSFEMLGYFSKEKESSNNYNLSCILTLPQYMNQGYGRFLIDFSYLLTKTEEKTGSPEKPLSDLGLISYRNYWISIILYEISQISTHNEISIKDLSNKTGILMNDIISTLQYIHMIKYWKGKHVVVKNQELIDKYVEKKKNSTLEVDPLYLKWNKKI